MTTEVEYLKAQAFGLLSEVSTPAFQQYEKTLRQMDLAAVRNQIVASDFDARQESEIDKANEASAQAKSVLDDFIAKQEDEALAEQMQASLVDTAARARYGTFNKEGLPPGLEASKNAYADLLFLQNRAGHFKVGDEGHGKLTGMAAAARERVVQSHMQNLGMNREEAEAKVTELFFDAENPSAMRDISQWIGANLKATGQDLFGGSVDADGDKRGIVDKAGHAAWFLTKGTGHTILRGLQIVGGVLEIPAHMFAGAAALNNKSVEEIREEYPEFHTALQKMLDLQGKEHPSEVETREGKDAVEAVRDFLEQNGTKYWAALKEGAKGFWDDLRGSPEEPAFKKYSAAMTDNPAYQRFIEGSLPMVFTGPVLMAEMTAARAAVQLSKYEFMQPTFWGRFLDFVVPGRPTSYMKAGGYKKFSLAELALAEEVTKAARTKIALIEDQGWRTIHGGWDGGVAFDAQGNPTPLAPGGTAREAYTGNTVHGRVPVSQVERVNDVVLQFQRALETNDLSDPYFRDGMKRVIRRVREAADATPEDIRAADAFEARIAEWEKTSLRDQGQTTAVADAAPPEVTVTPIDVAPAMETVSARTPIVPGKPANGQLGEATDQGIRLADDITHAKFLEYSYGSLQPVLDRMGYPVQLLRRLVTNDDEARLFVALHEEGHFIAKDASELEGMWRFAGRNEGAKLNVRQMGNEMEKRAMLHALHNYSRLTGRSFTDVIPDHVTPGSFAQFDPATGRFSLRGAPRPDMPPTRWLDEEADLDLDALFRNVGDSVESVRATVRELGTQVAQGDRAVRMAPVVDNAGVVRQGVHPEDFNELGELFGLVQKIDELPEDYGKRVYQAFVYRFGATKTEQARRSMRFPDADPAFAQFLSDAQLAKITDILHNWRAVKELNTQALGTRFEGAAADLALWYLSDVANAGKSYRLVRAAAEAMNRAAAERMTGRWGVVPGDRQPGLGFDPNASRGSQPPGPYRRSPDMSESPGMGTVEVSTQQRRVSTDTRSRPIRVSEETSDGTLEMRSIYQGRGRGEPTSVNQRDLSNSQGHVWPNRATTEKGREAMELEEGIPTVDINAPEKGSKIASRRRFGPNQPEATAARPDDAMARAMSVEDVSRRIGADGSIVDPDQVDEGFEQIIDPYLARVMRDRAKPDSTMRGPTQQLTGSLHGSPEQVRVMELEDFAGVKVHDGGPMSFLKEHKVNVFVTDSKVIDEQFGDLARNPKMLPQAKEIYHRFLNDQLARMANRLAESGGSAQGMLLFNRSMATAKAMQEVLREGAVSARTAEWLDSMSLMKIRGAQTVEEALLANMDNAMQKYGTQFTMQKNYQRVVDRSAAEMFDSMATTPHARERYVEIYGDRMSSPEVIAARREINAARAVIKKAVGDVCP